MTLFRSDSIQPSHEEVLPAPQPAPAARWRWFTVRNALRASAVLLFAVVVGVLLSTVWLRHSMRASLPQIDGTLHVAGLSAAVQVSRDAQGVPSLQAGSLDDLLFAQGFVTAQDRLWQMDALRRHGAGELAEILGTGLVDHDRAQRVLQLRAMADLAVTAMPADERHQLEVYARGVNAFVSANRDKLPVEFHLLHYQPRPWAPRDSVLVMLCMWQDLSTEFPRKMSREALTAHLPAALWNDLYPVGSWRDRPPTQPAVDLAAPRDAVEQIPLDSTQSALHEPTGLATPADLLHAADMLQGHRCAECRAGSNNWAVSAARSASGAPLLSNDMHLSLSMPSIWYEAGLHAAASAGLPELDVTGFTLPGVPFVIVGRNAHVAWGFTNLGADVQDIRIEHLRGSGQQTEYQRNDGSWAAVEHHAEQIAVRAGRDETLDVMTTQHSVGTVTMHTPIVSSLYPSDRRALSLAWSVYDAAALQTPLLAIDSASSGAALVAAFATFGGPTLNLIYADDQRHIGYHALGRIPIRGSLDRRPRMTTEASMLPPPPDEPSGTLPVGEEDEAAAQPPATPAPAVPNASVTSYTIGSAIVAVPVDALDAGQQWVGYIPYDELPAIVDPVSGMLATANARITPDDYPYSVANDWADAYRVERIYRMLDSRTALTPADMLTLEMNVHSEFGLFLAQRFAYAVDHASASALGNDTEQLKSAADLLRDWSGDMNADASAPAIVSAVRAQLWFALLVPQICMHDHLKPNDAAAVQLASLYAWEESATALETLLTHTPARWLPPAYADWNDFLAAVLMRALKSAHAPSDLSRWKYGASHPVEIDHPVFGASTLFDHMLGVATGSGAHPIGGDSTTIKATGRHFGPSERFTADLSNPDATNTNITTGESGNPASAWYLDQFQPWLRGTTFVLPLHPQAAHSLTLLP